MVSFPCDFFTSIANEFLETTFVKNEFLENYDS